MHRVEVGPVDCFCEGENASTAVFARPNVPAEAIVPDSDPAAEPEWLALNRKFAPFQ
jgi:ferredoxin